MEIQNIKKNPQRKTKPMSIRTTAEISKWMAKNNISPSKLFNEAASELMSRTSG